MSIYCVSDIHGQFDLFIEGLNKINFNHKKDKLYILGDICNIGPQSLKIYDYVLNNQKCIKLIKGNHDICFLDLVKIFKQVLKYHDVFEILKEYVTNYVSGFEKARNSMSDKKLNNWATTERRKSSIINFNTYVKLCKQYNIPYYLKLVTFYETHFKIRKLMTELVNNPNYRYDNLIDYINKCPLIETINIDKKVWAMYHSQYSNIDHNINSNLSNQLISRLKISYKTHNINYIYGHTPVPKVYSEITSKTLNYNTIFKSQDYNQNKYYNIDVSHFGLCFFNLETLEETYVGKHTTKNDTDEMFCLNDFKIENVTGPYEITKRFIIKKNDYFYTLAIYRNKMLSFYELCGLFEDDTNKIEVKVPKLPKIQEILKLFIETQIK